MLICPWNFPGKDTGVGCHFLLQGPSQPRDRTHVSCIADRLFTAEPQGKTPSEVYSPVILGMGNIHLKNKIFSREKGFFKVYLIHLDISQDKSFAENYSVKKLCCSARQPLPHRNRVKSFLVLQPGVVVIQLLSPA